MSSHPLEYVIKNLRVTLFHKSSRNLIIFGRTNFFHPLSTLLRLDEAVAVWRWRRLVLLLSNRITGHGLLRSNSGLLSRSLYFEWKLAFRLFETMTRHCTQLYYTTQHSRIPEKENVSILCSECLRNVNKTPMFNFLLAYRSGKCSPRGTPDITFHWNTSAADTSQFLPRCELRSGHVVPPTSRPSLYAHHRHPERSIDTYDRFSTSQGNESECYAVRKALSYLYIKGGRNASQMSIGS